MARVTAVYIPLGDLAHIQELDSWAGDLRSSALLVSRGLVDAYFPSAKPVFADAKEISR